MALDGRSLQVCDLDKVARLSEKKEGSVLDKRHPLFWVLERRYVMSWTRHDNIDTQYTSFV